MCVYNVIFANTPNMKLFFGICIAPNSDLNCYNYCHTTPYKQNEMKVLALITCWHNLNKNMLKKLQLWIIFAHHGIMTYWPHNSTSNMEMGKGLANTMLAKLK